MLFAEDSVDCDGTDATIISNNECTVTFATLLAEPYLLVYGSSVYAKVSAQNVKGSSDYSSVENGAVILTAPDPPVNLADNTYVTSKD